MARKTHLGVRFLTIFNRLVSNDPKGKVLLALSGGLDSVVLFELMRLHSVDFEVAHCNFRLRGDESDMDMNMVTELCRKNKIKLHLKEFNTQSYAKTNGISIEMAARELRYAWFEKLIETWQFNYIATAHHAGDNFETALLNLTKGSGISGFKGISPVKQKIIRPLLAFSKDELREFAISKKLEWREDASNANNAFQRNLIRNKVLPLLKEINPNLEHTFYNSSWRTGLWVDVLKDKIRAFDQKYATNGTWIFPEEILEDTEQKAVFVEFLSEKGFEINVIRDLVEKKERKVGSLFSGSGLDLIVERGYFLLRYAKESSTVNIKAPLNSKMKLPNGGSVIIQEYIGELEFTNPNCVFLQKEELVFPLVIRSWKVGDRMQPFGMKGTKLISDILTDRKIPNSQKSEVLVLLSGTEIVWLIGFKTSEKFKISDTSGGVVKVEFIPWVI